MAEVFEVEKHPVLGYLWPSLFHLLSELLSFILVLVHRGPFDTS